MRPDDGRPVRACSARSTQHFASAGDYGAAVVTAADFDLLVDLGADTIEQVIDRVVELRGIPGIGRTSTALADLTDNAIRPGVS